MLKVVNPSSKLHEALRVAALYQYGPETCITLWFTESSNHGDSYRGYDYHTDRWVQCDLDLMLHCPKEVSHAPSV